MIMVALTIVEIQVGVISRTYSICTIFIWTTIRIDLFLLDGLFTLSQLFFRMNTE